MEDSKKKPIMVGVIVVCLALAAVITISRHTGGGDSMESISDDAMIWVKCNNPACKAEYQMGKKDYFRYIEENIDPRAESVPPLICTECGKPSAYRAEKCGNPDCGIIFFRGIVPNELADRCPECGYSATEESRKRNLAERAAEEKRAAEESD